jgi:hypothetical protein
MRIDDDDEMMRFPDCLFFSRVVKVLREIPDAQRVMPDYTKASPPSGATLAQLHRARMVDVQRIIVKTTEVKMAHAYDNLSNVRQKKKKKSDQKNKSYPKNPLLPRYAYK